jgi:hypothetical protein
VRNRLNLHAEAGPRDVAVGNQLVGNPLGEVDRNREPEADAAAAAVRKRCAGGVDADEACLAVDECAPAVPGVDRRVGLNRAHELCVQAFSAGTCT